MIFITNSNRFLNNKCKIPSFMDLHFENAFSERIENTNVEHIFVVPLSSCAPCVQATLKFYLSVEAKNTGIITCGQPDNPETLELVMRLKGHDNVWSDDSITISKYRTNIGSPYYLSIKRGQVSKGLELDNTNVTNLQPIFDHN